MSTAALQQVWDTILGYNLTTANKRWLAEHLIEQVETETKAQMKPYTMTELNAMIDESEADFAAGRVYSMEESRKLRKAHLAKLIRK
ncbi:MAG: hypothetical protein IJP45_06505 [Paludibacteraceae bacterium]|nr:hypothetical protein [Paludibacteraceae bacterium]MBQ4508545.1 hypothetical protein [Paludibacteraceae bacterium]MBQ6764822.1 hypothetical protein [Paludibacteraceae bacterium]